MSKRLLVMLIAMIIISLVLSGCSNNQESKKIIIGGKADTEAYVLASLAKILLEEEGFTVETKLGVKSVLARQALENGEVDLYYDYTGTAYTVYHKQSDPAIMTDPTKVYDWVKEKDQEQGIIWLQRLPYNNTYTIMIRKEDASDWGIRTISQLAQSDDEIRLVFGTDTEFYKRPDGLQAVMEEYDLQFEDIKKMSAGIIYKALKDKKIGAGMGYSTDGRIPAFGFINLEDDKNFFPVYNPAPLIKDKVLAKYPDIKNTLSKLKDQLTTSEIQKLNARVDIEHQEPEKAARDWLQEKELI